MRYDAESGKILIGVSEMVAIARRKISPILPFDEDEPELSEASSRRLAAYLEGASPAELRLGFESGGYSFELCGRADGVSENKVAVAKEVPNTGVRGKREIIEQIRGEAFILAYMLATLEGYSEVEIRTLRFSIGDGEVIDARSTISIKRLTTFFGKCAEAICAYARPEVERVTERLPSMKAMKFPYAEIREGQSEFVRSAYRTLARGGVLYASAPTGTGKTVSALYPAMRALGDGRFDKIFYLTPKATTAEAARECLLLMEKGGVRCRSIILTAKEKCCNNRHACRTSRRACKNSASARLAEATLALYEAGLSVMDDRLLLPYAERYCVCPYELSLSYSELCDVVICDFNYLFDPRVYIKRYFTKKGGYAFLVDEAHNLPERVREMYSAELWGSEIGAEGLEGILPELSDFIPLAKRAEEEFFELMLPFVREDIRERPGGEKAGGVKLTEIPSELYDIIGRMTAGAEKELLYTYSAEDEEKDMRAAALRAYLARLNKFSALMERFDEAYRLFVFFEHEQIRVKIYCLDTSPVVRERLNLGHGAVLFSATLSPLGYYRSILGGERSDDTLEVSSPFSPEQLSVSIMDKISTRWSEREDTMSAVSRVIAATVSARRGNYMIFSPSFAYSEALARSFCAKYPKIRVISQTKDMTRREKEEFLAEFKKEDKSYLVAFCVMGGIYSEGIDLAGDSLIGAVIVGIGMPALSYERETIAEYFEEKYEEGKQYAYVYPGMNRVFQAAGRVIRREDDHGAVVLIDDRFADPIYKKSLPKLWEGVKFIDNAKRLREVLDDFWKKVDTADGEKK